MTKRSRADIVEACLIGTAFGDALGLPYENLSARRAARLLSPPNRMCLLFGRGMVSDDTERACLTTAALIEAAGDVDAFRRHLARRLRGWLLTLPAGAGAATIKGIARTMFGISPQRSGVRSAGNGPLMREFPIGLLAPPSERLSFVRASTEITHRDPRAVLATGVLAALAAALAVTPTLAIEHAIESVATLGISDAEAREDLAGRLAAVKASLDRGEDVATLASQTCRRYVACRATRCSG